MERFETLVETVALEMLGTTKVTYRGHDIDLKRPWRRLKLVDALEEHGVWSDDETELRAILEARGIDTTEDKTWAQLVDHALTNYVEPKLIEPTFLHDYPVRLSPFARRDRRRRRDRRALRRLRRRHRALQRLQRAERRRRSRRHASGCRRRRAPAATSRPSRATRTTSRRSPTACRRPAGSASGSTGSRWCSPGRTRSAT